ncbi:MAG TPA: hypothetical protein VNH64_12215 [Parvularculaceae bacterium]|nr:hypothetical protein [Parvularculaceae bacterium]
MGAALTLAASNPASADDRDQAESARLCQSKASLLKRYLETPAAANIERAGSEAAKGALAVARARLKATDDGAAFSGGCAEFDEALHLINTAAAYAPKPRDAKEDRAAYRKRYEQFSAYIKALSASPRAEWPAELRRRFAQADLKIAEAGKYAAESRFSDARIAADAAYQDLLYVVKGLNDGKLVVHQLVFKNPADEFRYEQDRNRSYEMLLQLAIKDTPPSPELAALVQRVISENFVRRAAAGRLSEAGDDRQATAEMEVASRELAKTLRLVGVMVWD